MVLADLVARKVARAEARLEEAEQLLGDDAEAFAADARRADLASFYLFLAIQEAIDCATHWVSDERWPAPDDVGGTFDTLAAHGAISRELAAEMRSIVRVRNRIAHGYATIDHRRLYTEMPAGIATLRRFFAAVAAKSSTS